MENAQTAAPAKKLRTPRKITTATTGKKEAAKAAPKVKVTKVAAAPKATKPSVPGHQFAASYAGVSSPLNTRASRTPIDLSRFGQFVDQPLTQRDEDFLRDLRKNFGSKAFTRSNLDAGNLRRLGERGCIRHVSGTAVDAAATFVLTNKGLGKAEPRAKKVA